MTQTPSDQASAGFSRILVGVDFSPASQYTLNIVRQRFPDATLRLAHVTDARVAATPDMLGSATPTIPNPMLLQTLETVDGKRLNDMAQEGEETELLVGDPVTGILDSAQNWGAELIVVGTHSRGALEHFFLGSTAEKVVSRSQIPVLTIQAPNK